MAIQPFTFTQPGSYNPAPPKKQGISLLAGMGSGSAPSMSNSYGGSNPALSAPGQAAPSPTLSVPMGVTAKTPTTKVSAPQKTLPAAQQNPVYTPPPVQPKSSDILNTNATLGRENTNNGYTGVDGNYYGTQAPTPTDTSFPGILGQLVGRANAGSPTAQNYTQQAAGFGAGSIPVAAQANDIAQQFGQKYADVGQQGAKFQAGQLTTGTSPVAEGNSAVTAQTTAAQQNALAQGEQAALQGIGYQLTGQNQAATAANSAAGQAYTGNAQALGALQSAAGQSKPEVAGYGQTSFNPATNSFGASGGGNLDPQTQAQSLAQKVISGAMTYDQAVSSMGYAGAAGTTFLNNAITGSGGNPLQLQAQGAANQNVIGTQTDQAEQYKSALQQGKNLQSQLTDLITTFGLNPNDVNAVNLGLQKIAQNVSSPQYKILSNYVNDIANTYSQVLTPPGGSATDTSRGIAQSMLDATAKGTSILQTMQSLDQAAQAKIAGVHTIGGSQSGAPSGGSVVQTKLGPINTSW